MKDENNLYQKTIKDAYTNIIQSKKKTENFLEVIVGTVLDDFILPPNQGENTNEPIKNLMDHLSL